MKILSNPDQVCLEHGLEFWTGLLGYASGRSTGCVKHERLCACPECELLHAAERRVAAILSVGPSPADHEDFPILLAS